MNDFNGGTQFDFTYAPGTSQEQILGFEMAGEIWSSYLNDDVTIRIHVESTSELPDEVVGAALPGKKQKQKYDKVRDALSADITSSEDELAFSNLSGEDKEFSVLINGQELDKTEEFRLTNANAKSLGLLDDDSSQLDGYIQINDLADESAVGWDYDSLRSNGASGGEIDFLSVAMHEIGHVLGFVSGIDDGDWLSVLTESAAENKEIKDKDFKFASTLDLYRYSDSSPSPGMIDLSVGGDPYFSIDGGDSRLGNFANGEYTEFGGDGYQASHWQQNSSQGIMNPVLPTGERRDVSSLDRTAMDVIGWDINTATPNFDEMYANAAANAENATIQDRSKDIEKLVRESGYDIARRPRSNRGKRVSWQLGFWQFSTIGAVDDPEVVGESEVVSGTETEIDPDSAESSQSEPVLEVEDEAAITPETEVTADPVGTEQPQTEAAVENTDNSDVADVEEVGVDESTIVDETEANQDNADLSEAEVTEDDSTALETDVVTDNPVAATEPAVVDDGNENNLDLVETPVEPEPEIDDLPLDSEAPLDNDTQEVLPEPQADSNEDNQPAESNAPDEDGSLTTANFDESEPETGASEGVDEATELGEIESNDYTELFNSYSDALDDFYVTGVANNEQDSLFN